jgi:hypothetical protein
MPTTQSRIHDGDKTTFVAFASSRRYRVGEKNSVTMICMIVVTPVPRRMLDDVATVTLGGGIQEG